MRRRYDLGRSDNYMYTGRVTHTCYGTGNLAVYTGFPVTSAIVSWATLPILAQEDSTSSSSQIENWSSSSSSYYEAFLQEITTTGVDTDIFMNYINAVNLYLEWGDGTYDIVNGNGGQSHIYSVAGVYILRIHGECSAIRCLTGDEYFTAILSPINGITGITNLASMFENATSIPSIPSGLFDNCGSASCSYTFNNCTSLTSIPSGLFDNLPGVTNFVSCFNGDTSLTGSAPTLWTLYPGATGTDCFLNCTGLSNYNDIPETWGGPAVSSSSSYSSSSISSYSSSSTSSFSNSTSSNKSSSSSTSSKSSSSSSMYSASSLSTNSSSSSSSVSSSSSSSSSYIENWSSSSHSSSSSSAIIEGLPVIYVSGYSSTGFIVTYENIPPQIGFIDFTFAAV